jgi:hypothetical protein
MGHGKVEVTAPGKAAPDRTGADRHRRPASALPSVPGAGGGLQRVADRGLEVGCPRALPGDDVR